MQLEVLGQLKNPMTLQEVKPMTFQLVALCIQTVK
jgi:hypothetical protein